MDVKQKIIIPHRLIPGDTIGVVAPSSPFNKERFYQGINVLESMGFRTYIPDDLFLKKGHLAGSDIHRAALVNRLVADKKIKAIICARGGFGSIKILPLLDFESVQKNPKIFIGFSDITTLLSVLYIKCGLVTFHGPVVTSLSDATHRTKESMLSALSSGMKLEITTKRGVVIKSGFAFGPVLGGNLTTLCHLVGTSFEPNFNKHILFLEDRGEASYRIDRMLIQMKLSGCFNGLLGLVLGSFMDCGKPDEIHSIISDIFKDINIPIITGFEIGHGLDNITIPIGIEATLNTDRQLLSFHKPATILA